MARKPGKSPQSIRDRAAKTAAVMATPAGSAPAEVRKGPGLLKSLANAPKFFREVRASGGFPRILAKLFHDLPGSPGRHSHTSTHAPPTSPAMRSGAMRTAALVAPAAGTTSPKARSETSQ